VRWICLTDARSHRISSQTLHTEDSQVFLPHTSVFSLGAVSLESIKAMGSHGYI